MENIVFFTNSQAALLNRLNECMKLLDYIESVHMALIKYIPLKIPLYSPSTRR